jgi:hypothetical protein
MEFNVGDVIIFKDKLSMFREEVDREQIVILIDDYNYHTIFLDSGNPNIFGLKCNYVYKSDIIRNDGNYILNNGVPMVWEDDL